MSALIILKEGVSAYGSRNSTQPSSKVHGLAGICFSFTEGLSTLLDILHLAQLVQKLGAFSVSAEFTGKQGHTIGPCTFHKFHSLCHYENLNVSINILYLQTNG